MPLLSEHIKTMFMDHVTKLDTGSKDEQLTQIECIEACIKLAREEIGY